MATRNQTAAPAATNTPKPSTTIQARLDALLTCARELGDRLRTERSATSPDFRVIAEAEAERNHLAGQELPPLREALAAAQLAELRIELESLDAQRSELQGKAHEANLAVQAARAQVEANPLAFGVTPGTAAFFRLRGQHFLTLAESLEHAAPINSEADALERKAIELRAKLTQAE